MHMEKLSVKLIIAGLIVLLIAGCAGLKPGNYGKIQSDAAVEQAFMAGQVKPNLTYYYLSSEDAPYVIIGVDKKLVLDDRRDWRLMQPQASEHMRRVVQDMYDRWRQQGYYNLRGFKMIDQNGRYIGDWYSIWDIKIINPVLFSKDETHVVIYPPPFPRLEPTTPGERGISR